MNFILTNQLHPYNSYRSSWSICEKFAYGSLFSQKKQLKKKKRARDILGINQKYWMHLATPLDVLHKATQTLAQNKSKSASANNIH